MFKRSPQHSTILRALRARIFLADQSQEFILRETALAEEFGLSRTPIRQVLQALSHEHLVQVKTGVGTIATKLEPEHRDRDFAVYSQLALAAANIPGNEITSEIKIRILGLYQMAEREVRQEGKGSIELFANLAQESGEATSEIVQDPILSSALAASRWRVIRWRILDYQRGEVGFWDRTMANFAATSKAAAEGDARAYLKTISGVVADMRGA